MILLCGIPSETPLAMVRERLEGMGVPVLLFNQRRFDQMELEFTIAGGAVTGELRIVDRCFPLEEIGGVYTRLMDHRALPELKSEPPDTPRQRHCQALHDALTHWYEIAPARVVNRTAPMGSNFSKPYQSQLVRQHGFGIPETLITNDPPSVAAFRERHDRVIYKSISGVRSIVQTLTDADMERLERVRWCPTQFQEYVPGTDIRVHVIGADTFATAIESSATDYRYAHRQGDGEADLRPVELPDDLTARCVQLTRDLGLAFAGIDLKLTPGGEVYCFEVNPSPAFSYYEANTSQPIAAAVARYLVGQTAAVLEAGDSGCG